jgi:hypothetical protein
MATCRDCKLYDLDGVRSKSGAILRNRTARCLWQSTEVWPASVIEALARRPSVGRMGPDDGQGCKRFIKRTLP